MPGNEVSQIEVLVGELRSEMSRLRGDIVDLRSQIASATAQAAAAQTQIISHTAVCEERQRLLLERQRNYDERAREQVAVLKEFMSESSADRASIHQSVQAGRTEARDAAIRVMWWVIVMGGSILGAMGGAWLKSYGFHL